MWAFSVLLKDGHVCRHQAVVVLHSASGAGLATCVLCVRTLFIGVISYHDCVAGSGSGMVCCCGMREEDL